MGPQPAKKRKKRNHLEIEILRLGFVLLLLGNANEQQSRSLEKLRHPFTPSAYRFHLFLLVVLILNPNEFIYPI